MKRATWPSAVRPHATTSPAVLAPDGRVMRSDCTREKKLSESASEKSVTVVSASVDDTCSSAPVDTDTRSLEDVTRASLKDCGGEGVRSAPMLRRRAREAHRDDARS